jgi:GNAT superfamily N-acetyltransferase
MSLNIRATCVRVPSPLELTPLREQYLDQLHAAQDALLEVLVQQGDHYAIRVKDETVGYFVLRESVLLELHLTPEFELFAHILLPRIVDEHQIRSALIKTFDHLFLACALDLTEGVAMRGCLVRDLRLRALPDIPRVRYTQRTACIDDLPRILAVEQDVFTHPERLRHVVEQEQLRLFERDQALIGFGILRPVIPGRADVEVGIAVDAAFRNKGYAVYMLRDLVDVCLSRGLHPICGSRRSNEASVRMGTRVGLLSRYRLIEVFFRAPQQPAARLSAP